MGNVEGQELDLENLTPEQRIQLQQQRELKLQQQQLLREQQQLQQRIQQQQQLGRLHQQTTTVSKSQAILHEQAQHPSPQDQRPIELKKEEQGQTGVDQYKHRPTPQGGPLNETERLLPKENKEQNKGQVVGDSHQTISHNQRTLHPQQQQHKQQQQTQQPQQSHQAKPSTHGQRNAGPHPQSQQPHRTQQLQQHPNRSQQRQRPSEQRQTISNTGREVEQTKPTRRRNESPDNVNVVSSSDKLQPGRDSRNLPSGVRTANEQSRDFSMRKDESNSKKEKVSTVSSASKNKGNLSNSQSNIKDENIHQQSRNIISTEVNRARGQQEKTCAKMDTPSSRGQNRDVSARNNYQSSSRRSEEENRRKVQPQTNLIVGSSSPTSQSVSARTPSPSRQHPQQLPLQKNGSSKSEPSINSPSNMSHSPLRSPMKSPMKSPMMPPAGDPFEDPAANLEADLSQLTEEERAHILAVLDRARQLQEKDESRVRDMESHMEKIEREISDRGYQSDSQIMEGRSCSICNKSLHRMDDKEKDDELGHRDCDDCGRAVCPECGSLVKVSDEEKERWLCDLCQRRRRFLTTSGFWHKYYSQIQPKTRKSRRSSLDEAFLAIRPPTKSRHQLVRTASYSMVDDMRKTMGEETARTKEEEDERNRDETKESGQDVNVSVDSDELQEEELLLLSRRSRDRSPEYERRTSAGQEEVLRDLRREERGFLVSDNTIEMDPIDACHVEDLSEGLDEEEMMRQLMEMADGVEEDFGSLSDHSSSSGIQSHYFIGENRDKYGEHQEILETTQQIAKFTESRNLSDYDLHQAATREDDSQIVVEVNSDQGSGDHDLPARNGRRDTPAVQALEETIQVLNAHKTLTGERLSSSLESSPARGNESYHSDSIGRSSSLERESDLLQTEISNLKHFIDVSSHSDSEIEQRKEGASRRRRKKVTDSSRGGTSESEDMTIGTDKFLSVEDLRDVGVDDTLQNTARDLLSVPNHSRNDTTTYEAKGNRPPAAGRGSGSNRRKKGKKYLESPLSPIRDDEVEPKTSTVSHADEGQKAEKMDREKFVYPPDGKEWNDGTEEEEDSDEYDQDGEMKVESEMERQTEEGDEDDYLEDQEDSGSSYLTSPGGLETVMEEQEEQFGDDAWTHKRNYAYGKSHKKRIVTVGTGMIGEEIEDSSPEESKQVLRLQEAPAGKRRSNHENGDLENQDGDEKAPHKRESPDHVPIERRMEKVHARRSPEMRQDDRKDPLTKDRPPLSRVVESTSPTSSPVSTRFRFSPPITPKLCSTGKTFPEATFPKDLTPTDETAHHEIVDENRNEIVERQETTPTNEIVGFVARGHQSPVIVTEKTKHSRKRHAVSTQTEKRKSHREMSTQTKSESETKRYPLGEKSTKSLGVQAGDDLEIFLPKKVLVDVGVETESDVSSTSSPVSFASSRSVGIETDSRDPNLSSGMSSPVSDVGNDRFYTETAVQTLSESFAQTDPISYDKSDFAGSPYFGMDRSTHTSPSLSYQATQDPKVAQALRAVLGDYQPPMARSHGMQSSAGAIAKSDEKSTSPYKGNGINHTDRHSLSEGSRSYGMQTSPLKVQSSSIASSGMSPSHSVGLSRPTSVSTSTEYVTRRTADGPLHRDATSHVASTIPDHLDTRISHSDTESIDSDLGTPRIRRRLPHVPAGSSPSASPVLGRATAEDTGDLQSEIELDKVKGLLSRKAIQLEMERRKHELDEMTSKICSQNIPASLPQENPKHRSFMQQKYRSEGSLSDSDIVTDRKTTNQERPHKDKTDGKTHQVKSSDSSERGKKEEDKMVAMGMDKDKYVQFSKSEEDIIREIERQVTEATGKSYNAFDQGDMQMSGKPKRSQAASHGDHDYDRKSRQNQYESTFDGKMASGAKASINDPRDQYETELESQRYWDIDTSPVHTTDDLKFPERDPFLKSKSELYPGESSRMSGSAGQMGGRRDADGSQWIRKEPRKSIPQLIKDNQNEVDRLSREGEEIERRIKELTALEEKLETDYQQYRTRVVTENQSRGSDVHPVTLADYILKSHEPSLRFEKTTDGQYDYTTAHWSNSDESLSGSGGKLASSSSESRLLPARPLGDGSDEREMEGTGLILPLEESSDFDGDLSSGSPSSQRREMLRDAAGAGPPSIPKRDLPAVTVHSETRQKQARQLPVPKTDPQHVTRSEGHRAHPSSAQQPPVPRRSRGERTSNIFHLKRNSNGPSSGSGSGGDLGLRVVGGKRMPGSNQLVAYITDVVEGGAAQKAGLREGDQVLEWCGTPLTGKTFEEVQLIMRTARKMADVTVKCGPNLLDSPRYRVQRPSGRDMQRSHHHSSNAPRSSSSHRRDPPSSGHRGEHSSRQVARPTSDAKISRITGELQVRLAYDAGRGELRVDVLRGRGLVGKTNDGLADPFVVVRLLPMKSSSDEKRTACVPRTLTPEWNQTLLFRDLRPSELLTNHSLELTIWSSSRNSENFMGKVIFNLSDTKHLDNRVHWYRLMNGSTAVTKVHKNIGFV